MHRGARARLFQFASRNRRPLTNAEQILWDALSNKQLNGWKFRRQHPCGTYILDFYCHQAGLCIEVDGAYHLQPEQKELDEIRTKYLQEAGIRVLRFTNQDVAFDLPKVLQAIKFELGKGHQGPCI